MRKVHVNLLKWISESFKKLKTPKLLKKMIGWEFTPKIRDKKYTLTLIS